MKSAAKKSAANPRVKSAKVVKRSGEPLRPPTPSISKITARPRPIETRIDSSLLKELSALVDDPVAWLKTPNVAFEGRKPIDLLGTDDEVRLRNRIGMASQGMFS